jgi:hypothetical protein
LSAPFGSPIAVHVNVAGVSGTGHPSGTVTFYANGQQAGALPLNSDGSG